MSFVNASLLFGTLLIAVPIALHLIMRQQPQHFLFPALRFVKQKQASNRRKLQLRHWLLLALRCGLLVLLAAALARPSWRSGGSDVGKNAPIAAAIVVDTSPSMGYEHQNATRLEAGQQLAKWILDNVPAETPVAVNGLGLGTTTFAIDLDAARRQVERLAISPTSRPLADVVSDAITTLQTKVDYRQEIYVVTDLSATSWDTSTLDRLARQAAAAKELTLYVIDVGIAEPRNLGISDLELSTEVAGRDQPVRLRCRVFGHAAASGFTVELFLIGERGNPVKRDQRIVPDIGPEGEVVEFQLTGLDYGTHQGYVQIAAPDGLAIDNTRFFTLDVTPARRILVAVENRRDAVFLVEALAPELPGTDVGSRFACDVERYEQAVALPLGDYAAVALLDPPTSIPDRFWSELAEYAQTGGGVAIFLGHNALLSFNSAAPQELLAGPLKRRSKDETYLSPEQYAHPVFARLRRYGQSGAIPWSVFPVFQYWQLGELAGGSTTIARYANGDPAILERAVGEGQVITMTTPVSDPPYLPDRETWNWLPSPAEGPPWPFLVMAEDLFAYLSGTSTQRRNFQAGETVALRLGPSERQEALENSGYIVFPPTGDGRPQPFHLGDESVTFSSTGDSGNYRIEAGGRQGALKRGFSVNVPAAATSLTRIDQQQLVAALGKDRVRFAQTTDDIEINVGLGRIGHELFAWLIAIVALVMSGEQLLANRFYRERS